ncbi:hypothetical protein D3C87_1730400 [compost metagenome]
MVMPVARSRSLSASVFQSTGISAGTEAAGNKAALTPSFLAIEASASVGPIKVRTGVSVCGAPSY